MGTVASVHNFFNAPKRQNILRINTTSSTTKAPKLVQIMPPDGSIDTRVLVLFQIYNLRCRKISAWPDRETSSRALQLLSTIRQSEFFITLLVLKKVFGYSVVLCNVKQKKSINRLDAVNTAHDIANKLKCLREKADYEFHQLYIFAQKTAKTEDIILKTPRLTSR